MVTVVEELVCDECTPYDGDHETSCEHYVWPDYDPDPDDDEPGWSGPSLDYAYDPGW